MTDALVLDRRGSVVDCKYEIIMWQWSRKKDKKRTVPSICTFFVPFIHERNAYFAPQERWNQIKVNGNITEKNSFDVFCTTRTAESNQGKQNTIEKIILLFFTRKIMLT